VEPVPLPLTRQQAVSRDLARCLRACNQPMLAVEPDQITHPNCDPDDTPLSPLSLDKITELIGDLGWCGDCGDPIRGPALIKRCQSQHKAARHDRDQGRHGWARGRVAQCRKQRLTTTLPRCWLLALAI